MRTQPLPQRLSPHLIGPGPSSGSPPDPAIGHSPLGTSRREHGLLGQRRGPEPHSPQKPGSFRMSPWSPQAVGHSRLFLQDLREITGGERDKLRTR